MLKITSTFCDLDKIAESGQCFRWKKIGEHTYEIPAYDRAHRGYNLRNWFEKYHITLKEFLINTKYIVVCDSYNAVNKLMDLGLFDWEAIEDSSEL